ncbi:acyl-CoA dehydrogenase [Klebsiella grimontii]|uniref:Acyl-CoA dehydrogenase n=1 Tax=Klebsiella grimontii TaxID=2058152 RepID=A0A7H4P2H9_9ENTR|nr:acyl-CoA dehydrogenase [Klebsiella grimontii]
MTMTRERFKNGLARVFIDCYAAIPSESIRRLLALREAGVISILALGHGYEMAVEEEKNGDYQRTKSLYV